MVLQIVVLSLEELVQSFDQRLIASLEQRQVVIVRGQFLFERLGLQCVVDQRSG